MADDDPFLQRFKSQGFHATLQNALNASISIIDSNTDAPFLPAVQRLRRGIEKAILMLTAVDAPLVSNGVMTELNNGANTLFQQLNTFASNKNKTHLNSANEALDTAVIPMISRMPKVQSEGDVTQIFDALSLERNKWQKAFDTLQATRDQYMKGAAAVLEERGRVDTAIQKQESRISEIVTRSDEAIAQFNTKAAEADRVRDKAFSEAVAKLTTDITALKTTTQSNLTKQQDQFTERSAEIVADLDNYRDKAKQLLQVIGDTSVSAPFANTAHQDRRAALILRCLAGLFFAGMVATVVYAAWELTHGSLEFHWEFMLFRFMTALIFAIPAYYFAREASKFQDEADRNRRIQLELASIGPFIDALDATKKAALREELARTYFKAESVSRELEKPFDPNGLVDVMKELIRVKK